MIGLINQNTADTKRVFLGQLHNYTKASSTWPTSGSVHLNLCVIALTHTHAANVMN